ncbi:MAG: B12-binding domain-containing radical SAM protein [Chlorobium sp.]
MDINLDFHRWLFSSDGIGALGLRIRSRIDYLEEKSTISSIEATILRKLIVGDAIAQRLQTEIDSAVDVLTSEKFYNPHLLTKATDSLAATYGLVGSAFFPSRMDFITFHSKVNPATQEGLTEITQDDVTNPYRYFFSRYTIPTIRDLKPRLIGISISAETQWVAALTLCRMLRESGSNALLVLGGGVPTRLKDVLAKTDGSLQDYCDIIVTGEGEEAIVELANCILQGKPVDDIAGSIAYLKGGMIRKNQARSHIPFERLPTPNYTGLCLSRYFTPKPVLPVMLARGCFHRCAFCDHSAAYSVSRSARTLAELVAEMNMLQQQHGTTCFAFADESLPVDAIRGIAAKLECREAKLSIAANFRGEANINAEDWRAFARTGLRLAQFGIESGSQRVLNAMHKGTVVEVVEASLRQASYTGIWNHGFIMFGFPSETEEDVAQTIELLERNRECIHSVGASQFHLMRNSAIANNPEVFGVTLGEAGVWSLVLPHNPCGGMTVAETETVCASFNSNTVTCLPGAALWQRLERSQLLLYLERYSRETILALGDDLDRSAEATSLLPRLPIDVELSRLTHDVTDTQGEVSRSGSPLPLLVDGRSRSVSLLSDEAWIAVNAWRKGSSVETAAHNIASALGIDHVAPVKEIEALWLDLHLAEPNLMNEEPLFEETSFLDLRTAIDAPESLPNSALPEWLGIVTGIKPGMRITLYGWTRIQLEVLAKTILRRGLAVQFGEFRSDGLAHLSEHERSIALAASPVYAYIARTVVMADMLAKAESQGGTAFGRALGYPDCCVQWLARQDAERILGSRPPNLPVIGLQNTKSQCCAELNNLLWHLPDRSSPFYFISHYPCSYSCQHSAKLARSLHKEIELRSPDAAQSMVQALSRPVVIWDDTLLPQTCWDENKGLVFDGSVVLNRIHFSEYMSLRKERDYSDLGLAFSDELVMNEDRVLGMREGRPAGCWWAADHGKAHIFDFRW